MIPQRVPQIPCRFIHGPITLVVYDFKFWFPGSSLLLPLRGSPLRCLLPPPPKGPPLSLLISIVCPLVSSLLKSPIRDGLPF